MDHPGPLRQIKRELQTDNATLVAAGVAFYALLGIFPALIAMVTGYALISDAGQAQREFNHLGAMLPTDAANLLVHQLTVAAQASEKGLTVGLVLSLLATWWAATGATSALITGLDMIYDVPDDRGFLRRKALALALTLGGLLSVVLALALVAVFPVVLRRIGLDQSARTGAQVARWVLMVGLAWCWLWVLYRFGPARRFTRGRLISEGAAVALVVWLAASFGFSAYVTNFGRFNETYGGLAAVVVLALWLYLSSFAVLLGAEIDAVLEDRRTPGGRRERAIGRASVHGTAAPSP